MGKRKKPYGFSMGQRLKWLRTDLGMTQREVADSLNMPVTTYSNYENDNRFPNQETMQLLCEHYMCSENFLLGYEASNSGDRIRSVRMADGLSREQLAERAGVSMDVVGRAEMCDERISAASIRKIAKGLGVTEDYLLCRTTSPDLMAVKVRTPVPEQRTDTNKAVISDDDIKFALFGGGPVTDAEFEEVKQFARFIAQKHAMTPPAGESDRKESTET